MAGNTTEYDFKPANVAGEKVSAISINIGQRTFIELLEYLGVRMPNPGEEYPNRALVLIPRTSIDATVDYALANLVGRCLPDHR